MLTLTRGSLRRLRPFARALVVLKTTFSPSVSIQTTLVCGAPVLADRRDDGEVVAPEQLEVLVGECCHDVLPFRLVR